MDRIRSGIQVKSVVRLCVMVALTLLLAACQGRLIARETPPAVAERSATPTPTRIVHLPSPTSPPSPTGEATFVTGVPTGTPSMSPAASPTAAPEQQPTPTSLQTPTPRSTIPPRGRPSPTATAPGAVTPPAELAGHCDLALDKTLLQQAGTTNVTVTITVQNRGTASCPAGAVLDDPVPTGMQQQSPVQVVEVGGQGRWQCAGTTCTAGGSLPPGYAANLVFTAALEQDVTSENCAQVTVLEDANTANNIRCVSLSTPLPTPTPTPTSVACLLGFEKVIQLGRELDVTPGWRATLRITVQNVGPEGCVSRWPSLVVSDLLPVGMRLQGPPRADDIRWECEWSPDTLQCEGPIPAFSRAVTLQAELTVVQEARTAQNCATLEPLGANACAVPSVR